MNLPYEFPDSLPSVEEGEREPFRAHYWYPKNYFNSVIALEELKLAGDQIVARSKDEGEEFSGRFSNDQTDFSGVWTDLGSGRERPFSVRRVAIYKTVFVSSDHYLKQQKNQNGLALEQPLTFSATFPVFGQQRIDGRVLGNASKCEELTTCYNSGLILWKAKQSLVLDFRWSGYSEGAAHGGTFSLLINLDTSTDSPRYKKLDGFYDVSRNCLRNLSEFVVSELRYQGYSEPKRGAINDFKTVNFFAIPNGIVIRYDMYQVGAYPEGEAEVFVNKKYIKECVRNLPVFE